MKKVMEDKVRALNDGKRLHVIMRATASMRDMVTAQETETTEWYNMATGVQQYFVNTTASVASDVQSKSVFKGIEIMADEEEGKHAYNAVTHLCANVSSTPCTEIDTAAKADKLVIMEQGGASMQIWANQIQHSDGTYPDETGLFSNMGNDNIAKQLKSDSKCFGNVWDKQATVYTSEIPDGNFNQAECLKELKELPKYRQHSAAHRMPRMIE